MANVLQRLVFAVLSFNIGAKPYYAFYIQYVFVQLQSNFRACIGNVWMEKDFLVITHPSLCRKMGLKGYIYVLNFAQNMACWSLL